MGETLSFRENRRRRDFIGALLLQRKIEKSEKIQNRSKEVAQLLAKEDGPSNAVKTLEALVGN
jgi:hypothetical protein